MLHVLAGGNFECKDCGDVKSLHDLVIDDGDALCVICYTERHEERLAISKVLQDWRTIMAKDLTKLGDVELAKIVEQEAPNEYAKAYAKAFTNPRISTQEDFRVQWLYVMSNWDSWRGEMARAVKAEVKLRYNFKRTVA